METDYQDTTWLQLESLIRFGEAIGLVFNGRAFQGFSQRDMCKYNVSLCRIQQLHNSQLAPYTGIFTAERIRNAFSAYTVNRKSLAFNDVRIVERTYLTWHNSKKAFVATQNQVKFI